MIDLTIAKEAAAVILIPVARSVAGWAQNSLKDGMIDEFEKAQLFETVLRVGMVSIMTYLGLTGIGVDVDVLSAAAIAYVIDVFRPKTPVML